MLCWVGLSNVLTSEVMIETYIISYGWEEKEYQTMSIEKERDAYLRDFSCASFTSSFPTEFYWWVE